MLETVMYAPAIGEGSAVAIAVGEALGGAVGAIVGLGGSGVDGSALGVALATGAREGVTVGLGSEGVSFGGDGLVSVASAVAVGCGHGLDTAIAPVPMALGDAQFVGLDDEHAERDAPSAHAATIAEISLRFMISPFERACFQFLIGDHVEREYSRLPF